MTEYRQAFCPVCGTSHGNEVTERVEGKPYIKLARGNYWDKTRNFSPDKPFGVIQETMGRGTFRTIRYFQPEDDVDGFFPLVKERLMQACREWIEKGWMTREELEAVLG